MRLSAQPLQPAEQSHTFAFRLRPIFSARKRPRALPAAATPQTGRPELDAGRSLLGLAFQGARRAQTSARRPRADAAISSRMGRN